MDVIYKCSCMARERLIQVPDRIETTPIVVWVECLVLNCVGFDHSELNPHCTSVAMEYMKIPVLEHDEFLGQNRKPS